MIIKIRGLDVWGNENDGFEVNDVLGVIEVLEVDATISDKDLVQLVTETCLIGAAEQYQFDSFSDLPDRIFGNIVHVKTGKPIVEIRSE